MAAPGSIVLAVADPSIKRDHPNHLFTSLGGHFDSQLCFTPVPFTIHPYEHHVLLTDLDQIYGAVIKNGDTQGPMSVNGGPLQLCYAVRLTMPDMMLQVGKDTSLSLLLRAGCLQITSFAVSKEQSTQMLTPPAQPVDDDDDDDDDDECLVINL